MSRRVSCPSLFAVWLLVMLRVFGGAALLYVLDAPSWAIAAWLMLHLRFRLPTQVGKRSSVVEGDDRTLRGQAD